MSTADRFLTPLMGCLSVPAGGNPTGRMMAAAFEAAGLEAQYVNCEVPPNRLEDAVTGASAMGWRGFNLSLPHKVEVMRLLDRIGESATLIGAVNCVVLRDGRMVGENTDGRGFLESLREVVDPTGAHVVVLGAGGAARAVAIELGLAGARRVTVVNRDAERGADLATSIARGTAAEAEHVRWEGVVRIPREADVVVNATSVGMDGLSVPAVDLSAVRSGAVAADVVIRSGETGFLAQAREGGLPVLDGLGMLVNQGVLSLRYWLHLDADRAAMRRGLAAALDGA